MKLRETLLGLVVLALLAGGVFWARGRGRAGSLAAGGAAATQFANGGTSEVPAPDVTLADGSVDLGDVRLVLSATPRPILPFAKTRFRVRAESRGAPLPIESGRVSFQMAMPMGDHRYALVAAADGWHEADVVLPLCQSGDRRWFATVEVTAAGRLRSARFQLELTPPASAPPP